VPAEAWAVFSAFCFAGSHVVSKRGLQDTSVTAASLIILGVSWAVIASSLVLDPPHAIPAHALMVYGGLGLIVPAISRWSVLKSVDALGPSIAIPIQQGLRPLLAVSAAALILGEDVGVLRAVGVLAIVGGGWQLSKRPRDAPLTVRELGRGRRSWFRPGVVFPLIAAAAYAASDLIVRFTLGRELAEPAVAATISTGSGLAAWLLAASAIRPLRSTLHLGRRAWWLVLSGALVGLAILGIYHALRRGEVSIVSPINATQPLMVLLLSALFLRDLERIRPATVVAALAIVGGAILVSAG
jgi:drug/metabolite transporter (DMT)-like permease